MHISAFASPFTPQQLASPCPRRSASCGQERQALPVTCATRNQDNFAVVPNTSNSVLPLLASGLAALSVLLGAPVPANAGQMSMQKPSIENSNTMPSTSRPRQSSESCRAAPVIVINQEAAFELPTVTQEDSSSCLNPPEDTSPMRQGTLLLLDPPEHFADQDSSSGRAPDGPIPAPAPSRSHNASSRAANALPGWPTTRMQRQMYSPDRLLRLRPRARPATLGLVGFGAFTSGSVLLRSVTRKNNANSAPAPLEKPTEMCSVVCMHIPFCVPERERLLDGLARLANEACLETADGMAAAARCAAALLLEEGGLLEDSSKFAPSMDVCLADDIVAAERRFSGHVEIETHRSERISGKHVGYDVSPHAKLGRYGVVTLIIATPMGVNLDCYDKRTAIVKRLRAALDAVCRLESSHIAGMELRWIPDNSEARSLTRVQLADSFPCLRVT